MQPCFRLTAPPLGRLMDSIAKAQNLRRSDRSAPEREVTVTDDDCNQFLGQLADLSLRGMRVIGTLPLPLKRNFHFRLEIPDQDEIRPVCLAGTCVRSTGVGSTDEYESGISFDSVIGQERNRLKTLMQVLGFFNHLEPEGD